MLGGVSAAVLAACAPALSATGLPTTVPPQPTLAAPTLAALAGATATGITPATALSTAAATGGPTQAAATGASAPTCIVRPALTEGPYFVDEKLNRSDVRSDPTDGSVKNGAQLNLAIRVSQINGSGCVPLAGATVDIWHCDALGVYSDASDPSFNTKGKKFLRGYQVTDANGTVQFITIYPGWYQGRAVHLHFKIRTNTGSATAHDFTSQFFFDDTLTDQVHARAPYASKGAGRLRNADDGIYQGGGDQLLLALTPAGQGYSTTFDIGLQF